MKFSIFLFCILLLLCVGVSVKGYAQDGSIPLPGDDTTIPLPGDETAPLAGDESIPLLGDETEPPESPIPIPSRPLPFEFRGYVENTTNIEYVKEEEEVMLLNTGKARIDLFGQPDPSLDFAIGFIGTILGTAVGIGIAFYLQEVGIDISSMMKNAKMVMSDVMRTRITPGSFIIGFVPGLLATFLGTSISGIGIYKRQTSRLMKELEV